MPTDVFISYSTRDTDTAQAICLALESAGISCWIAPRNITPGQTWSEAIIDGINGCQVMVLLYTSASIASPQVLREVERAVSKRLGLIAFRAENVNPSKALEYLISVSHWLEAYTGSREEHLASLVQCVRSLLTTRTGGESPLSPVLPAKPVPAPPALPPHNLPEQLTSFIGREKQREEVKELLQTHRLVTLTGAGGTGKTRLSLKIGADLLPEYKEGVWLVELASLSDPSLVTQTVSTALGIREEPGRPLLDTLTDFLKSKTLLLLLDNCEHVLDVSATLAETLLKRCADVRILATSRERLGISGEQNYRVPPLSTPERNQSLVLETLPQYESVRLFLDRITLSKPDFVLTAQAAPAVASVCHRLDGIPLAIELAAARGRAMPVEQIEARLEDRFRLLTGGSRTALPRQQTLRALLDWSYDLLNNQEKMLLHRLSVFSGGWTLDAAEKVCSGEGIEDWEVLDLLLSLSDKSLVVYEEQQGEARYRLLETVHQYSREKLEANGGKDWVQRKHRDYFLGMAEQANRNLSGREQRVWLEVLEREHDNLRQGLEFCLEQREGGTEGLRLGGALQNFWIIRGHWSEGRERLRALLAHPLAQERTKARGDALNAAGALAYYQGDYASARFVYEQSLEIRRELGDKRGIAYSLSNLGSVASDQGDYSTARSLYEQSLAIQRELGDKASIAICLHNLGNVAYDQDDYASARSLYEQSLAIQRELGDKRGIAYSLLSLGNTAYNQDDYSSAYALLEESLAIRREVGDKRGIATCLNNLGNAAYDQGDYASARSLYEESLAIRRELGDLMGIAYSLEGLAHLKSRTDQTEQAVRLWGAAQRLREEIGSPLRPNERQEYDRYVTSARQALGEEAFTATWAEGRAMTMEQAIELALKEPTYA